jgi:predicted RND superfamily exporter protein
MDGTVSPALQALFRRIIARRRVILVVYALVVPLAIALAFRIETDNSIARLVVQGDADFRDNQEFQRLFPEGEQAVLLVETADPFAPGALGRFEAIERRVGMVPKVQAFSALALYDRTHPGARTSPGWEEDFRRFATGTDLFRKQGLVGSGFLGLALDLQVRDAERDAILSAIDAALDPFENGPGAGARIPRVGGPWVDAYLEAETARASRRSFPLFGLFVVTITLVLFRSLRTLAAFLLTLAASVALTVAAGRVLGFTFTIVSSLVPLTILVTCTAALVYLQSRFAECPEGTDIEAHRVFALANKFVATTASLVAAAIGFAALVVSGIRPIREMGLWVAAGLLLTWGVVFTLFPALQAALAVPVLRRRTGAGRLLLSLVEGLPRFSYRSRWVTVLAAGLLMAAGAVALAGFPGVMKPLRIETDALDYIRKDLPLYKDMRRFEQSISGLSPIQAWITAPEGALLRPDVLRGVEDFARALEADRRIGSVTGPTTILRFQKYVGGEGDRLPDDPAAWSSLAAELDRLLLQEPAARSYVDVGTLANARLAMVYRGSDFGSVDDLKSFVRRAWEEASARHAALRDCRLRVVGEGLLQAKIGEYLVPTLTESFALTVVIIFVAFLVVFRSGAARLLAMIPSLFAILVMFLVMRLVGIPLNVATILIASTVLGASENDQIHFFYHFQEKGGGGTTEQALRHALFVAGRAILFATLINAGGFLALGLSGLPPMRQFGIVSASAFVLSMLASLTILPSALWIVYRQRPDAATGDNRSAHW